MLEIKLILCPIDFSEFSVRAYRHALSLAEHYRAKVVAQHIVELSRYPYADYAASSGDYAEFCRTLGEGGKEQLREFVKKHFRGEFSRSWWCMKEWRQIVFCRRRRRRK